MISKAASTVSESVALSMARIPFSMIVASDRYSKIVKCLCTSEAFSMVSTSFLYVMASDRCSEAVNSKGTSEAFSMAKHILFPDDGVRYMLRNREQ